MPKVIIDTDERYPCFTVVRDGYVGGGLTDIPQETLDRILRAEKEWGECQDILDEYQKAATPVRGYAEEILAKE